MLKTATERALRLRTWRADPRNAGLEPPVEIAPLGLKARRRATLAQKKAVQQVLRRHQVEIAEMQAKHVRALLPALHKAQQELQHQLREWIHRTPDGELRWSAWKYRSALAQLHSGVAALEQRVQGALERGGFDAQRAAARHLINDVARFSEVFGDELPRMQLNLAKLIATGHASLVPRYRASAERYAWGQRYGVWADLNKRLAVDILKGASVEETIDRLQREGGPRGLVALQGVAGEENAIVELVPEGLFARYRWRAEMYVRTEFASAYGAQTRLGFEAAREILPDLQRRWCTDGSGCPHICQPMDGQVVGPMSPSSTARVTLSTTTAARIRIADAGGALGERIGRCCSIRLV
jgi:hypothetical protein